jgi:hypothetical protein
MVNLWTPEAKRLEPSGFPGTLMGVGGAKVIAHCTVGLGFNAMDRVLREKQGEPHYLYDPVTDELGQYFSIAVSSRSLKRGYVEKSCNKAGTRVIQIEFVAMPDGFTRYWKPGPNFRAMMRDIRAQGVPDEWLAPVAKDGRLTGTWRLTWENYLKGRGWIGHCSVPAQDHWDPGPIDTQAIFTAAPGWEAPDDKPTPRFDPKIKELQTELVQAGLLKPSDVDGIDGKITQGAKERYMARLDDIETAIQLAKNQLRKELVLDGGVGDRRYERQQNLLTGIGTAMAALGDKLAAGDAQILSAVESIKRALAEPEVEKPGD